MKASSRKKTVFDHFVFFARPPRMQPLARVQYLPVAQSADTNACSTIAEFIALYLCYSKAPSAAKMAEYIKYGERQWLRGVKLTKQRACELASHAHARHPELAALLKSDDTIIGLSVKNVRSGVTSFGGVPLERSVQAAFERVQEMAARLPLHHAIGFSFCRSLYRVGGCARSVGNGAHVVFDLVDSHRRVLAKTAWMPPASLPNGSAVWVRADNAKLLADALEAIYPPAEDDSDLLADERVMDVDERSVPTHGADGAPLDALSRQRLGEKELPQGYFEIILYKPRYETPMDARSASEALAHAEPEAVMAL